MKISFFSILLTVLLVQTVRSVPFTIRTGDDEILPFPSESPMIPEESMETEEPSISPDYDAETTEPDDSPFPFTDEPLLFTDEPVMEDVIDGLMPSIVRQVVVSTPDVPVETDVTDGPTVTPAVDVDSSTPTVLPEIDETEIISSPVPIPPIEIEPTVDPVLGETLGPVPTEGIIETIDPVVDTTEPEESTDEANTFCEMAFDACDFRFMGSMGLQEFSLTGIPDVAITTAIVAKDSMMAVPNLSSDGQIPEIIGDDGSETLITVAGAIPPFTPTHLKTFTITGTSAIGIGHESVTGNQESLVRGQCFRVSFSAIANDCVVFKINA